MFEFYAPLASGVTLGGLLFCICASVSPSVKWRRILLLLSHLLRLKLILLGFSSHIFLEPNSSIASSEGRYY